MSEAIKAAAWTTLGAAGAIIFLTVIVFDLGGDNSLPIGAGGILLSLGFAYFNFQRFQRILAEVDARNKQIAADTEAFNNLPNEVIAYLRTEIAAEENPSKLKDDYTALVSNAFIGILAEISYKAKSQGFLPSQSWLKQTYGDYVQAFGAPFARALSNYAGKLPDYVGEPAIFNARLSTIPHYQAIESFFFAFKDTPAHKLFTDYERKWHVVQDAVNGKQYKWGGKTFYTRLTGGLSLDPLFNAQATVPITIPDAFRLRGVWIVAPQGRGKTTLLSALLKVDLERVKKGEISVIVMDSQGQLVDAARQLAGFKDRMVLIEPSPHLAINMFDLGATRIQTVELLEDMIMGLIKTDSSERQRMVLNAVLHAMTVIPGANIDTFREFLALPPGGWKKWDKELQTLHPDDYKFFADGKYDAKQYEKVKTEEIDWRIERILKAIPDFRDMLKATSTRLNMGELMDSGKLIVIDTSEDRLGKVGAKFLGRFFLSLIFAAAQQRQKQLEEDRLPCFLYMDECDMVIAEDDKISEMIARCRKQKVGVVLAHQWLSQLISFDVRSAVTNCAVRFGSPDTEAKALHEMLRTSVEHLNSLDVGQFTLYMNGLTKEGALTINVQDDPITKWPRMKDHEMAALRLRMKEQYCYAPDEVPVVQPMQSTIAGDTVVKDW